MNFDPVAIYAAVADHAFASGKFSRVNQHEPKSAPTGVLPSAAIWAQEIGPYAARSGLAATTALLVLNVRVYSPMVQEPPDAIDPAILDAVAYLIGAYSGNFELNGVVANVDLLGASGQSLRAQAGYLNQDNRLFRVMTITLPLIINDAWEQDA